MKGDFENRFPGAEISVLQADKVSVQIKQHLGLSK